MYLSISGGIYLFKVNNWSTRLMCETCSKLTEKISDLCHWRHFGIFIFNFEQISYIVCFDVSIVDFEQVNGDWDGSLCWIVNNTTENENKCHLMYYLLPKNISELGSLRIQNFNKQINVKHYFWNSFFYKNINWIKKWSA